MPPNSYTFSHISLKDNLIRSQFVGTISSSMLFEPYKLIVTSVKIQKSTLKWKPYYQNPVNTENSSWVTSETLGNYRTWMCSSKLKTLWRPMERFAWKVRLLGHLLFWVKRLSLRPYGLTRENFTKYQKGYRLSNNWSATMPRRRWPWRIRRQRIGDWSCILSVFVKKFMILFQCVLHIFSSLIIRFEIIRKRNFESLTPF